MQRGQNLFSSESKENFVALFFFLSLPLILNGIRSANICFNGFDIGIYLQGITEISIPDNLNPYLSVRGLKAFNDHFNPALIIYSVVIKFFALIGGVLSSGFDLIVGIFFGGANAVNSVTTSASAKTALPALHNSQIFFNIFGAAKVDPFYAILLEYIVWLAAIFLFLRLIKTKDKKIIFWACSLLIFSKGILTAVFFPVHVDFWSIPLWILFAFFIFEKKYTQSVLCLLGICLFKESYPISFLLTSIALMVYRQLRLGVALFVFCILMTIWNIKLRSVFLGEIHGYGLSILGGLFFDTFNYVTKLLPNLRFLSILETYLLPIIFVFLAYKKRPKETLLVVSSVLPLFGLQVAAGLTEDHYSFPMVITGLSVFFFSGAADQLFLKPALRWVITLLITLPGLGYFLHQSTFLWRTDYQCQVNAQKRESFRALEMKVNSTLDATVKNQKIIAASGGVVPNLLRPGRDIRQIQSFSKKAEFYDYLILEKGNIHNAYPLDSDKLVKVSKKCESFKQEVLYESEFFSFWKGPFPDHCLQL